MREAFYFISIILFKQKIYNIENVNKVTCFKIL